MQQAHKVQQAHQVLQAQLEQQELQELVELHVGMLMLTDNWIQEKTLMVTDS